jgi:hypothetical protein
MRCGLEEAKVPFELDFESGVLKGEVCLLLRIK